MKGEKRQKEKEGKCGEKRATEKEKDITMMKNEHEDRHTNTYGSRIDEKHTERKYQMRIHTEKQRKGNSVSTISKDRRRHENEPHRVGEKRWSAVHTY